MYIETSSSLLVWSGLLAFSVMMMIVIVLLLDVAIAQIRVGAQDDDPHARLRASACLALAVLVSLIFFTTAAKAFSGILDNDPTPFNHAD